jgi:hypothetical protein
MLPTAETPNCPERDKSSRSGGPSPDLFPLGNFSSKTTPSQPGLSRAGIFTVPRLAPRARNRHEPHQVSLRIPGWARPGTESANSTSAASRRRLEVDVPVSFQSGCPLTRPTSYPMHWTRQDRGRRIEEQVLNDSTEELIPCHFVMKSPLRRERFRPPTVHF